jgi:tRNA 2-thiouridine synthesizing protein B
MLHTVNKPPIKTNTFETALRFSAPGEPILLIEDGVHAARTGAKSEQLIMSALENHPVFALEPDLKARGINSVIQGIEPIGYDGFVELVENHQVVTWT